MECGATCVALLPTLGAAVGGIFGLLAMARWWR